MRIQIQLITMAVFALWLPACESSETTSDDYSRLIPAAVETGMITLDTSERDRVTLAAAIATEIRTDVAAAAAILEKHEMSMKEFEAELYAISLDPRLANAYDIALGKSE